MEPAGALERIAYLLDRAREKPYRVRAYLRAAEGYAAYMERNVDPRTGVLRLSPQPFLLDQASLVQVNAYIALARRGIATN